MIRNHPKNINVLNETNQQFNQVYNSWLLDLTDEVNQGEPPHPTQSIAATIGIQIPSPVNNLIMRIIGDGGAVNITADPQISFGFDGQTITLEGMDDTNTVQLDDGNGLKLAGGASFTLSDDDVITLHYNGTKDLWIENTRSQN